jgi:hypothetical protein
LTSISADVIAKSSLDDIFTADDQFSVQATNLVQYDIAVPNASLTFPPLSTFLTLPLMALISVLLSPLANIMMSIQLPPVQP